MRLGSCVSTVHTWLILLHTLVAGDGLEGKSVIGKGTDSEIFACWIEPLSDEIKGHSLLLQALCRLRPDRAPLWERSGQKPVVVWGDPRSWWACVPGS